MFPFYASLKTPEIRSGVLKGNKMKVLTKKSVV